MNFKKIFHTIAIVCVFIYFSFSAHTAFGKQVSICSFNVQFIGQSEIRNNYALTDIVKDYDIVVVQEVIAPPYAGFFPDGDPFNPDPQATEFFDYMTENGFTFVLSEEDTGKGRRNHNNSSATEWFVVFYKKKAVSYATDLPHGFLDSDVTAHPDFDRVPYAFGFRTVDKNLDFVLISVHLHPDPGTADKKRRAHELKSIYKWIQLNNSVEKDIMIVGDMNIENKAEYEALELPGYITLNKDFVKTNTARVSKPYDHVFYNETFTQNDINTSFGFQVVDLVSEMKPYWRGRGYPGKPYNHTKFRQYFSDHNPVVFEMKVANDDD